MKKLFCALLLLLASCAPAYADSSNIGIVASSYVNPVGGSCTGLNGFTHCRSITISSSQVAATQTEFPVLISGTYSYLATTAHSGFIQNTTTLLGQTVPADLIYTSDSACTTLLNWEVESYNATSGAINVWVNTPISSSSNTTIYECYGKSSITSYQATASSVWDSNYAAVYHFPNGSTLSGDDSTVNGTTCNGINSPTAATGFIDGGMAGTGGTGSGAIGCGMSALAPQPPLTASAWYYPTTGAESVNTVLYGGQNGVGDLEIRVNSTGTVQINKANQVAFATTTGTVSFNAWNFIAVTIDSSNNIVVYINNNAAETFSAAYTASTNQIDRVGFDFGADSGIIGTIDEGEISGVARSANWIKTQYNNQNSPSTFYTVGSQT